MRRVKAIIREVHRLEVIMTLDSNDNIYEIESADELTEAFDGDILIERIIEEGTKDD